MKPRPPIYLVRVLKNSVLYFLFEVAFPTFLLFGMLGLRMIGFERGFVRLLVLFRYCHGRADAIERLPQEHGARTGVSMISRVKTRLEGVFRYLTNSLQINDQQFSRENPCGNKIFCTVPFEKLVINSDGRVQCGSSIESPILGDLQHQTLSEIWNGQPLRDIRSEIIQGRPTHCGKCRIYGLAKDYNIKEAPKVVMDALPSTYWIEPISVCNFDCPVRCGNKSAANISPLSKRGKKMMKFEDFQRIVGMLGSNTKRIGLFNYGEPFLHPRIIDMINYVKKIHPNAFLFANSNGSRLADDKLRNGLISSGLDELHLSIDGSDQESYGTYRRGGNFQEIIESISAITATKGPRPKIQWQYILFFWNDSDEKIAKALRIANDIGVDRFVFQISATALTNSKTYAEGSSRFREISPFLIDTRRFKYAHEIALISAQDGQLVFRIRNAGDIRWNSREKPWGRYIRFVGFHQTDFPEKELFHTQRLTTDVEPGAYIDLTVSNEAIARANPQSEILFDLQLFDEFYFQERGSVPFALRETIPSLT